MLNLSTHLTVSSVVTGHLLDDIRITCNIQILKKKKNKVQLVTLAICLIGKANQSSMVKYKAYLDQQCSGKRPGNTCHMLFPDQHYLHCMREGRDISYAYQTIQLGVYVGGMAE